MKEKDQQFEMVPCPVCHRPMPKKRLELGYTCCVNCSTEGRKVCMIEGIAEGDGVQPDMVIMTQQEARSINSKRGGVRPDHIEDESSLDMKTFEEQETVEKDTIERDRQLLEYGRGDFGGEISERTLQDMEAFGIFTEAEDDNFLQQPVES